jgi:hypothetical protein
VCHSKVVNLSIDVSNSFNYEHFNKSNFSRAMTLSIDVSNSFIYEHPNKFKY